MSVVLPDNRRRRGKPAPTNARAAIVRIAMSEDGITGDPRDYVLVRGSEIVTAFGTYSVTSRLDGREVDPTNVEGDGAVDPRLERTVVHRSRVWKVVGKDEARLFWKYGRRTRR